MAYVGVFHRQTRQESRRRPGHVRDVPSGNIALRPIHGHDVDLRLHLKLRVLGLTRRIHGVAKHKVVCQPRRKRGLGMAAGDARIAQAEAPPAGIFVYPTHQATKVEFLPVLQLDVLLWHI